MTKKTRRHHTPDQKINLLRRHHLEKVPVSEVCEGAELQPSVFYHWQRHLFEHGAAAFGESRSRGETSRERGLLAENDRRLHSASADPIAHLNVHWRHAGHKSRQVRSRMHTRQPAHA